MLFEIVTPKGRRTAICVSRIILVTENDDVTGPPGLLLDGVTLVQPVVGETYDELTARVALAKTGLAWAGMTKDRAVESRISHSPVPVYNDAGVRVLPNGELDRSVRDEHGRPPQAPRIIS